MISGDFEFLIGSPIENEKLICEIWYKDEVLAELSQETNELLLEIYASQRLKWWAIPLLQLQNALEEAKMHLLKNNDV